jgi:hypothetical protein
MHRRNLLTLSRSCSFTDEKHVNIVYFFMASFTVTAVLGVDSYALLLTLIGLFVSFAFVVGKFAIGWLHLLQLS